MFREQARANLRIARLITWHDLSGQTLSLSVFHTQQCMKKQLKAIMLGSNEALGLGTGNGFLRELSHKFYQSLHTIRKRLVKNLGLPPEPVLRIMGQDPVEMAFRRNEQIMDELRAFWANYGRSDSTFSVAMWTHSMRVDLLARECAA